MRMALADGSFQRGYCAGEAVLQSVDIPARRSAGINLVAPSLRVSLALKHLHH
jgi:hypothetical protein